MTMTKQDFQAVADSIAMTLIDEKRRGAIDTRRNAAMLHEAKCAAIEQVAHDLADKFKARNSNFKRNLFLTACGLKS